MSKDEIYDSFISPEDVEKAINNLWSYKEGEMDRILIGVRKFYSDFYLYSSGDRGSNAMVIAKSLFCYFCDKYKCELSALHPFLNEKYKAESEQKVVEIIFAGFDGLAGYWREDQRLIKEAEEEAKAKAEKKKKREEEEKIAKEIESIKKENEERLESYKERMMRLRGKKLELEIAVLEAHLERIK